MTSNQRKSAAVIIEDLNLSFGTTHVLKGVNLEIKPGEFFAFLGPSGSGKSTLLRAIAGFGPEPKGRILIDGEDIARHPPYKRDVGMVFQSYALWPHLSVRKNVAFGLEERRVAVQEIKSRVEAALDMVGLLDLADRRPSQLSGGQQQRVAFARTIVVEPKVLLLDEPLSNLDANLRVQMRRDIRKLQQELGLTTIFVTHDQEEANTTSDRMAVLDQGVIQQVGSPMELYDSPSSLFVARFLGTANVLEGTVSATAGAPTFRTRDGIEIPLTGYQGQVMKNGKALVFRPQNVMIRNLDVPSGPKATTLTGTVSHMEFQGSIIRYAVDVKGSVVMVDEIHHRGSEPFLAGSSVCLEVSPKQLSVLSG
ncbi:MAG: ABC transporter ATP-binding protein [Rhodospirillaceae bacterium]